MSKLDDELAQELGREAALPIPQRQSHSATVTDPRRRRSIGLLVALLGMVIATVSVFLFGFKEAAIYAITAEDLLAAGKSQVGRKVRVEGELVPGSLVKRDQPCEYRFRVHSPGKEQALPVRYAQCVIPDTFRDVPSGGVQVTVEGAINEQREFEATLVMAKCSSKYDPASHEMKAEAGNENLPVN